MVSATVNPVSQTAYYCCAVRALDAAGSSPVCGDGYAERFMTPKAWTLFAPFRDLRAPNASNVARHRMIDDLLKEQLARRPDTGIVIIGAGFDTRAFRLPGGRWVELDEPALIELKEAQLPAHDAPNPLTRISIRFELESLASALGPYQKLSAPTVVLEGVLPYLTASQVERLFATIRSAFVDPTVICDLTTRTFARRYAGKIGKRFRALGAPYGRLEREPLEVIRAAGFQLKTQESIVGQAVAFRYAVHSRLVAGYRAQEPARRVYHRELPAVMTAGSLGLTVFVASQSLPPCGLTPVRLRRPPLWADMSPARPAPPDRTPAIG